MENIIVLHGITNSGKKCNFNIYREENKTLFINIDFDGDDCTYLDVMDGYIHVDDEFPITPKEIEIINKVLVYYFAKKIDWYSKTAKNIESDDFYTPLPKKEAIKQILKWSKETIISLFKYYDLFDEKIGIPLKNSNEKIGFSPKNFIKSIKNFNLFKLISKREQCYIVKNIKPNLGGSWQKYATVNFIEEAEKMGEKVYLA